VQDDFDVWHIEVVLLFYSFKENAQLCWGNSQSLTIPGVLLLS